MTRNMENDIMGASRTCIAKIRLFLHLVINLPKIVYHYDAGKMDSIWD